MNTCFPSPFFSFFLSSFCWHFFLLLTCFLRAPFFCRSLFFLPLTFPFSFSAAHYFFRRSIFFRRSLFPAVSFFLPLNFSAVHFSCSSLSVFFTVNGFVLFSVAHFFGRPFDPHVRARQFRTVRTQL